MYEQIENEIDAKPSEHYELLAIVSANYTPAEAKPIFDKITSQLKEQGSENIKMEDLGKMKFAYPIKGIMHGYYQALEFDLLKENLQSLNRTLQLNPEVLRYLIVKKEIKTPAEIAREKAMQDRLAQRKEKEIEKMKTGKSETKDKAKTEKSSVKVNLEDLDKKLDEILDSNDML